MRTLVVIPTYDEAANVASVISGILALDQDVSVMVVDDASPDGTGAIVTDLCARHPGRVELITRARKGGHGSAYREGMLMALDRGGHDALFVMDGDSSHDPSAIPAMIDALHDADAVIGSRYVPGGRITGWGAHRRLLSNVANRIARALLALPWRDCTAGFMGFRREALLAIPLRAASAEGYGAPVELKWHLRRARMRVVEVPITFCDRTRGVSKLGPAQIARAAAALWRMRFSAGRASAPGSRKPR